MSAPLNRQIPPAFQPLQIPRLARPVTETLSTGTEITGFFQSSQSLVSLELVFPAQSPSVLDRQLEGYTFKMLAEGTQNKSAKQIADAISVLGGQLEFSHSPDFNSIHITCLSRFLSGMLDLLGEIWAFPSFPEKEWKTLLETQLHQNEVNLQKTSFQSGKILREHIYGKSFDYGYSFRPEIAQAFTPGDFSNRFQKIKQTAPALVLLAGNPENKDLEHLKNWLSSTFSAPNPVLRDPIPELKKPEAVTVFSHVPNSQQASLRMGQHCISSRHPDSALFSLCIELFGGYFGSRLMQNIREDKGWTYGIYAQRIGNLRQPYWSIGTDLNGDSVSMCIGEIHKEALRLQEELVNSDELEKVKNYMMGQLMGSITHCFGLSDKYRSVWSQGTSFDRIEENHRIIQNASPEDIREIARKYLHTTEMVVSHAGPE
jgi:predicted Zn-dependent peptidase